MGVGTAVLILPAALVCLLPLCRREASWRDAFLRAMALFGVLVTLLTEALGGAGLLRRAPLLAAWVLISLAAIWIARRRAASGQKLLAFPIQWPGLIEFAWLAGIGVIVAIVGLIAVLSPPNSSDAMGYHLPRVVYWAQAGSVAFFPTPFYQQIMMPPLAEYLMLHTWLLSGGDRFVNLVQLLGLLGSVVGVSAIAELLGAGRRGQIVAAGFCATLPNGILQASGAKNDYFLSLWLVASVYFAMRFVRQPGRADLAGLGASLGLAFLTKGTAYVLAPPLLAGAVAGHLWRERVRLLRAVPAIAACVLLLNGPLYWRNLDLSGSPFGYSSAHGDGRFRWLNDRFGVQTTVSNLLRASSEHLGARSPAWNQWVFDMVVGAHQKMGLDPNDPATTWLWAEYEPPRNSNHEANAHNRWHLLALALAAVPLALFAARGERQQWLWYYAGIVFAFVLFCSVFRWQPYLIRMQLPLFVAAAPVAGALAEKLLPWLPQAGLCLLLLNNTRPYLFENWVRPLAGPNSLLRTSRADNYFSDIKTFADPRDYQRSADLTVRSGCTRVGIDGSEFPLEYPYQALLLRENPGIRFFHVGVTNRSAGYQKGPLPTPCAVLCLDCVGNPEKRKLYQPLGEPAVLGRFLLWLPVQ